MFYHFRTKSIQAFLVLLVLLGLWVPSAVYADISVSLRLDRKEATLSDSVQMVVIVSGARNSDAKPTIKGLEHFNISSRGSSSRLQIINGDVSASVEFTYYIQPQKTGTFQLGPAQVIRDGKTFASNSVSLKVGQQVGAQGDDKGPLFLQAYFSSTESYIEEQIVYTLKLFRQIKVSDVSLSLPDIEHLTFRQLGEPSEYQSVVQGKTYSVLEVRYAVVASKAGAYAIQPSKMGMTVYKPRDRSRRGRVNSPFFDDSFFSFSQGRSTTLNSDALELEVLPLPDVGRPADFGGLVGTFRIDSGLVPSEIKAGESATLTVRVTGQGNANRIPDLNIPEPTDIKIYADQPVLEIAPDSNGLSGMKTMKWALVPEKPGRYEIPSLAVSFFDTKRREYRSAKTSPSFLTVLPGKGEQIQRATGIINSKEPEARSKLEITTLGQDILPVHTSVSNLTSANHEPPKGWFFLLVLGSPCLIYTMTFCAMRIKKRSEKTMAATKAKKAGKLLVKKCNQGKATANDFSQAVRDYFNDRFELSLGSLTPDDTVKILTSQGVSPDTANRLKKAVQKWEDAIYTGKGTDQCDLEEDLSVLIKAIEKEIG